MTNKISILILSLVALSLITHCFSTYVIPDPKKDLILTLDSSKRTQTIKAPLNKEFFMKLSYDGRSGFGYYIFSNSDNRSLLTYDLGRDLTTRIEEKNECKENFLCVCYQYYRFKAVRKGKYVVKFSKNMLGYKGDTIEVTVDVV